MIANLCFILLAADTVVAYPRVRIYDHPSNQTLLNGEREIISLDKGPTGQELYVGFESRTDGDLAKLLYSADRGQTWTDMAGIGWSSQTKRHCSLSKGGGLGYMTWNLFSSTFASVIYVTRRRDATSVELADRTSDFYQEYDGNTVNRWYPTVAVSHGGDTVYSAWLSQDPNTMNWVYADYSYRECGQWNCFNTMGYYDFDVIAADCRRPVMRMDSLGYIYLQYTNSSNARIYLARPQVPFPTEATSWINGLRAVTPTGYTTEIASATSGSHTSMEILGAQPNTRTYHAWASTDSVIYFRKSTDGGERFLSDPLRVSGLSYKGIWPELDISAGGDTVMIAWRELSGPDSDIYMDYSLDGGQTWHTDVALDATAGEAAAFPHIAIIENCAYVIYNDNSWLGDVWMVKACVEPAIGEDEGEAWSGDFRVFGLRGLLVIRGNLGPSEIRVYDAKGCLVAHEKALQGEKALRLRPGVYFVRGINQTRRAVVY
ncbi:MAG: hypothetical protein ABIN58_03335 [candidate division WOR-3 bacterium]